MKLFLLLLTLMCTGVFAARTMTETRNSPFTASPMRSDRAAQPTAQTHSERTDDPALDSLLNHLSTSCQRLESLDAYQCVLEIQEVVNGRLRDLETVDMKLREMPFSVYMRWRSNSQEAIYADGANNNKMLVHPSGALAAIRRVWKMAPESRLALQSARYTITDIGLLNLSQKVHDFYKSLPDAHSEIQCGSSSDTRRGAEVTTFTVAFPSADLSPNYSKCLYCFDAETGYLIHVENYDWSGQVHPVEYYSYYVISALNAPDASVFDHTSAEYGFVTRR